METCQNPACDKTFAPRRSDQRYCSEKCYRADYYAQHRAELAAQQAAWYARNRNVILAKKAAHRAARRARVIEYLGGACVGCGSTEHLDIDHISPGAKSFTVSENLCRRWDILEPELRKCQLLCRSCHVRKTELETPGAARVLRAGSLGGSRAA